MKELSIEDKAKAYDEVIERAREWSETKNGYYTPKELCEEIFPELAESEDERIRKELLEHCKNQAKPYIQTGNKCPQIQSWITWLEKQGSQKSEYIPKFKVGDWIVFNGMIFQIIGMPKGYYRTSSISGIHNSYDWEIDRISRLWTIQEARPNDVLRDWNGTIFIFDKIEDGVVKFKVAYNEKWDEEVILPEGTRHLGLPEPQFEFRPVDTKDRDILFQKMKEAGYVWDWHDMSVKKVDAKPSPKFKVGDWVFIEQIDNIINGPYKIKEVKVNDYGYVLDNIRETVLPFTSEHCMRLWTIQDAKDGDVLAFDDETIVIFKDLYNTTTFHSYCHIEEGVFGVSKDDMPDWWDDKCFHPATKEQRSLLFAKMEEAGYEWDAEKKELKEIIDEKQIKKNLQDNSFRRMFEHKPTWSEEDDYILGEVITHLEEYIRLDKENYSGEDVEYYKRDIAWLKSLRPQNRWKPSDKQLVALTDALSLAKNCGEECAFNLRTLHEQLKKLREE